MALRPIWKGQIPLSLESIPVEIFSATKSGAQNSFRQIHRKSGKRIHYDKVVEGIGPVDVDDILVGLEGGMSALQHRPLQAMSCNGETSA